MYDIPVLDMTTDEFCDRIVEQDIDEEMYRHLRSFLRHADLVKFAKLIPDTDRVISDFDEAHDTIEKIRLAELARLSSVEPETEEKSETGVDIRV